MTLPSVTPPSALVTQWCLALILLGGAALIDVVRGNWGDIKVPERDYDDEVTFKAASATLPPDSAASKAFYDNAAALYKTYKDSIQTVETKIGTLLGFVGGGTGVLALLSGTNVLTAPTWSPLFGLAILSLVVVFYSALSGLRPITHQNVNVEQVCDTGILASTSGATTVHALMGWQYLEAARKQVAIVKRKARWLKRCYNAFTLGVFALILNVMLPLPPVAATPTPASTKIDCSSKTQMQIVCTVTTQETKK